MRLKLVRQGCSEMPTWSFEGSRLGLFTIRSAVAKSASSGIRKPLSPDGGEHKTSSLSTPACSEDGSMEVARTSVLMVQAYLRP